MDARGVVTWRACALLALLSPLLGGGAHCGYTRTLGPVIDQDFDPAVEARAAGARTVRLRREVADYTRAELVFRHAPGTVVRACGPEGKVLARVQGQARVPIAGACVEVAADSGALLAPFVLVTDIGRVVVFQRNFSPHDGGPRKPEPGETVGDRAERWTLWRYEIVDPAARDGGV